MGIRGDCNSIFNTWLPTFIISLNYLRRTRVSSSYQTNLPTKGLIIKSFVNIFFIRKLIKTFFLL